MFHIRPKVAWPIVAKLCHVFDGHPDLYNSVRDFGGPNRQNFSTIFYNFATWSWISPERNKTSSVGKRPDFWPTQQTAIRLCIAVHLVFVYVICLTGSYISSIQVQHKLGAEDCRGASQPIRVT